MSTRRPRARPLTLAVATLFACIGCRADATAPATPAPAVAGTYLLTSVGGVALPVAALNSAGDPRDLFTESLDVHADGTFVLSSGLIPHGRALSEGPAEYVIRRGQYTASGAQLTLTVACDAADRTCTPRYVGTLGAHAVELRADAPGAAARSYGRVVPL